MVFTIFIGKYDDIIVKYNKKVADLLPAFAFITSLITINTRITP